MTDQPSLPAKRTAAEMDDIAYQVIEAVKQGFSAKSACRKIGIAFESVWLRLTKPPFVQPYQEAFALRAQMWAEELTDISDDTREDRNADGKGNMAAVARARLQVDTRKWLLSKLIPKQYGDQLTLTGADGGPIQISWADKPIIDITPDEPAKG